jgi:hypothetical protein
MLNLQEEIKFAKLKAHCKELGVPAPPDIFIGFQVHDQGGVLVFDDIQRGHSWNRNFWNMLLCCAGLGPSVGSSFDAANMNNKNTAGVIRTGASGYCVPAGLYDKDANTGIFVGTGNTVFSPQDYILEAEIANGTGAGELSYAAQQAAVTAYDVPTKTWTTTLIRKMNNNSAGVITVKETGLKQYVLSWNGANDYVLVERSVLSPTIPVLVGAQLTITYQIIKDFSAID